jgi:hypothetical protein
VKRVLAICLFVASIGLVGCGTPEASSVMENADQSAIEAYEAAIAEQDAAMEADPGDADDTDEGTPAPTPE